MKGRTAGRLMLFALGLLSFSMLSSARVWAQTASPTASPATKDCSEFTFQEDAQTFYNAHKNDTPGDPDPFDLDADGDGTACEGLQHRNAAAASASPAVTPAPGTPLNNTGAETTVMALSGFTFLEAGVGMTLLARKMGLKRRQIPAKLMRMLIHAGHEGKSEIAITDDVFLVRKTASATALPQPVVEESIEDYMVDDDEPVATPTPVTGGAVYASLAQGKEVDRPGLREPVKKVDRSLDADDWPYFTPPVS